MERTGKEATYQKGAQGDLSASIENVSCEYGPQYDRLKAPRNLVSASDDHH